MPDGIGKVPVPPRDYRSMIEQLRADHRAELDRLEQGILSLERRTFEQGITEDNLSAEVERIEQLEREHFYELSRAIDRLQRDSLIDERIEALMERAQQPKPASEVPDGITEVKTPGGTRVRAPWWVAIILAVLILAIVAIWQVEELAKLVR